MIKQKKILLILDFIPFGIYFLAFFINWKAAGIALLGAIVSVILSEIWKSYN